MSLEVSLVTLRKTTLGSAHPSGKEAPPKSQVELPLGEGSFAGSCGEKQGSSPFGFLHLEYHPTHAGATPGLRLVPQPPLPPHQEAQRLVGGLSFGGMLAEDDGQDCNLLFCTYLSH